RRPDASATSWASIQSSSAAREMGGRGRSGRGRAPRGWRKKALQGEAREALVREAGRAGDGEGAGEAFQKAGLGQHGPAALLRGGARQVRAVEPDGQGSRQDALHLVEGTSQGADGAHARLALDQAIQNGEEDFGRGDHRLVPE